MRISNFDSSNLKAEEFNRIVSILLNNVVSALNGGLSFSDNFSAKTASIVFPAANTEVRTDHNLGRIPTGYIVLSNTAAAIVYDGVTANSSQFLFLRASAPTTATVMFF